MKRCLFAIILIHSLSIVFAQSAVRDEPRHHHVFENEYVRILDVHFAPKDTTDFHRHATPSVFIFFTKTATGSELKGQQASRSISVPGTMLYDSLIIPRVHRVWNEDTGWFHVMDVEFIAGKAHTTEPMLQDPSLELIFDQPLVRGYKLNLIGNEHFQFPPCKAGYLLVSFGDAEVVLQSALNTQRRYMKAGHYYWIEANREVSARLNNSKAAVFTLLQLK